MLDILTGQTWCALSKMPPLRRYQEKFYFNPGDTGFKVFHTKFATIGVAICWDQWFPEAARAMALQGAEARTSFVQCRCIVHAAELAIALCMLLSWHVCPGSRLCDLCA